MTRTKIAIAAALVSATALMPTMAQAQLSEPAAYQAAHPDRDVLNGGALTPWGAEQAAHNGAANAYGAMQGARAPAVGVRPLPVRRYRHIPRS